MPRVPRFGDMFRRLHTILGVPGLMIGLVSLVAFGFGLLVVARESDLPRRTGRAAFQRTIEDWARTTPVDDLSRTLRDYADQWHRAAEPIAHQERLRLLRAALAELGATCELQDEQLAFVRIVSLDLTAPSQNDASNNQELPPALASWRWNQTRLINEPELIDRIPFLRAPNGEVVLDLVVGYRIAPELQRASARLETSYRRLLLAVLGLSGYSLLCLGYMVWQAQSLRERAARESAQQATIDLADRTCHELGNVVFVLSNERRNLSGYLDLIDEFYAARNDALNAAARRAGLDEAQTKQLRRALRQEYADRGLDPEVELHTSARLAREICRQIAVCTEYIALTVRELDAYLKQSSLPPTPAPLGVASVLDEALTLLGPRLESAAAQIERPGTESLDLAVLADRRLLVHALVNLLKNALEATSGAGVRPRIVLDARQEGASIVLAVTDNGPGIPPENCARLFTPGFSTKGPGRGRGLAIASDSIRIQGGELAVSSSPGKGTTFTMTLPAAGGS